MEIPFALAFTAGLVATVNPCGFAMLPAYLAYFMGMEGSSQPGSARTVGRGLVVGAVVSAGFLTVFGVAGVLITLGVQAVVGALPWAAMVVGVAVAVLGVAMLAGFELTASLPKLNTGGPSGGLGGVYVFGLSYAVASLSCTLPIFLVVVAGTIPKLGFVSGVLTFLVYGLGMSMLLVVVTLALALGRQALVGWLRRSSRHINRVTGGILLVAGAYIVWFWATALASGGLEQGAGVVFVEQVSSLVTNLLGDRAMPIAVGLGVTIAVAGLYAWSATRRSPQRDVEDDTRSADEGSSSRT